MVLRVRKIYKQNMKISIINCFFIDVGYQSDTSSVPPSPLSCFEDINLDSERSDSDDSNKDPDFVISPMMEESQPNEISDSSDREIENSEEMEKVCTDFLPGRIYRGVMGGN